MRYALVILLLLCSLHAEAEPFENWTPTEKALFAATQLALLADYKSTSSLLYPDRGYRELNPLIGEQPGNDRLAAWFVGLSLGHYFIADYLGHEDRKTYLWIVPSIHAAATLNNLSLGATIKF